MQTAMTTGTTRLFDFFFSFYFALCTSACHTQTVWHRTGVCLFKRLRFLLISNLISELCPTACVLTWVRDHTAACQRLPLRAVVSHSLIISAVTSTSFECASHETRVIPKAPSEKRIKLLTLHLQHPYLTSCSFIYISATAFYSQNLVNKFSSAINDEKSRVSQLEEDTINLSDDISTLKDKVEYPRQGLSIWREYQHVIMGV